MGRLRATLWKNESKDNGTWFSITLSRTYFDEKSKTYKSATSFGRDDLPVLSILTQQAFLAVVEALKKKPDSNSGEEPKSAANGIASSEESIPF